MARLKRRHALTVALQTLAEQDSAHAETLLALAKHGKGMAELRKRVHAFARKRQFGADFDAMAVDDGGRDGPFHRVLKFLFDHREQILKIALIVAKLFIP